MKLRDQGHRTRRDRRNGAVGESDIEGKAAMVAASELGSERVSNERERVSQSVLRRTSTPLVESLVGAHALPRTSQLIPFGTIRAAGSDFEARRLLRQSARHQRQRAPGTGPMLVSSVPRYRASPLSKPGIDLCTPRFLMARAVAIVCTRVARTQAGRQCSLEFAAVATLYVIHVYVPSPIKLWGTG
jgi:hypothetical protein